MAKQARSKVTAGKTAAKAGAAKKTGPRREARLRFDFIKSNAFRVIHVDGVWGGVRPDLNLHMSLYSERHAIPKSVTLLLDPEKHEESGFEIEERDAVIREVEVCAIMDLATAQSLKEWLIGMLDETEKRARERTSEPGDRDG